ncbi:MAG: hypothetical protein A3D47_01385 [Candidatus Colwellbacteria bacterium RIFCSPHIGHO2_02_FULL_43_15]|uniref:Redox-regulated ATPase YchF n=1 Tax=Candidatus Colwellbacteria bacterium RIFCSPHIGHO2_02_FULL_43_15 TaxID=1797686 RepID=A0A1G1YY60_9BACT|nr:MAG: hypothetical protein A3D47_01385 [Candidatus Colwellbacteria bacterium RIFCSPHIGHO2_02_FULL_43_15]
MSIGIVGLPNVGKSTLFKLLTKQEVNIANYPFATIDPNVGVVTVPDERLTKLTEMSKSKKLVPAVVEFYDIAGLVKGAYKGEGLGNQFLSHIRDVRAVVQVVRVFKAGDIIHVENDVNPIRDIDIINTELVLKDVETVDKRVQSLEKESKSGDKEKIKAFDVMKRVKEGLATGMEVRRMGDEILSSPAVEELSLLTSKPQMYLLNGAEGDVTEELKEKIKSSGGEYVVADLSLAADINFLIKKAYEILGLISFLTTGEDETRAWTIRKGAKAPEAAGEIHTDFEKKFIRADVVNWEKLFESGSWASARQKGIIKTEGKEYVIQDGDVLEIKHG